MKVRTKRILCRWAGWLSFLVALGLVGGVENGASIINMVWAFVALLAWVAFMWKGGAFNGKV